MRVTLILDERDVQRIAGALTLISQLCRRDDPQIDNFNAELDDREVRGQDRYSADRITAYLNTVLMAEGIAVN